MSLPMRAERDSEPPARSRGRKLRVVTTQEGEPQGQDERPIRVFLLDDLEIVRRGLRESIEDEDNVELVGEAGTAAEALEGIAETRPDVAVLDIRLPDGNGIEVCRQVLASFPEIRCLMLTSFADDEALVDAVMAGATGYVLKETRVSELIHGIRKLARGESLLDQQTTQRVFERLRRPMVEDRLARLSDQERAILDLIGEGLTNREISARLHLAEQTVKNYISRLLSKLGVESRTQAALVIRSRSHDASSS